MFLPRADTESDGCSSGHISCAPPTAVSATDTSIRDPSSLDPPSPNPRYMGDGPHRYIGIGMVAVMFTISFFIWLYYTKCPRNEQGVRDFRLINCPCCRGRHSKKEVTQEDDLESVTTKAHPNTAYDDKGRRWSQSGKIKGDPYPLMSDEGRLEEKEMKKPRFEEARIIDLDADAKIKPLVQTRSSVAKKEKRRSSGRRNPTIRGRSGVRKEVSGGMVIYTEVAHLPRATLAAGRDRESRNMSERRLEHMQGVRYEVSLNPVYVLSSFLSRQSISVYGCGSF